MIAALNPSSTEDEELLNERRKEQSRLRRIIQSNIDSGASIDTWRAEVYIALLIPEWFSGDSSSVSLEIQKSLEKASDKEYLRVIRVDSYRTRSDHVLFRKPEMHDKLCRLISLYCERNSINYKQGINEIFAPFLLLRRHGENGSELPDGTVLRLVEAFIHKFLPHMYDDDDFFSLQCAFRLFRLLLQYHDPQLFHKLDQFDLVPELYATAWYMTLFAQSSSLESVYIIWDAYLLEDDSEKQQLFHTFVALSLLCANRKVFLEAHGSDLPILLSSLSYFRKASKTDEDGNHVAGEDDGEAAAATNSVATSSSVTSLDTLGVKTRSLSDPQIARLVIQRAKILMDETPAAFKSMLLKALFDKKHASDRDLRILEKETCLRSTAEEVLSGIASNSDSSNQQSNQKSQQMKRMNYILFDCRPREDFIASRINSDKAFNIDPQIITKPEYVTELRSKLHAVIELVEENRNTPVSIFGERSEMLQVDKADLPPSLMGNLTTHFCIICKSNEIEFLNQDEGEEEKVDAQAKLASDIKANFLSGLLKIRLPCVSILHDDGGKEKDDFENLKSHIDQAPRFKLLENKLRSGDVASSSSTDLRPKGSYSLNDSNFYLRSGYDDFDDDPKGSTILKNDLSKYFFGSLTDMKKIYNNSVSLMRGNSSSGKDDDNATLVGEEENEEREEFIKNKENHNEEASPRKESESNNDDDSNNNVHEEEETIIPTNQRSASSGNSIVTWKDFPASIGGTYIDIRLWRDDIKCKDLHFFDCYNANYHIKQSEPKGISFGFGGSKSAKYKGRSSSKSPAKSSDGIDGSSSATLQRRMQVVVLSPKYILQMRPLSSYDEQAGEFFQTFEKQYLSSIKKFRVIDEASGIVEITFLIGGGIKIPQSTKLHLRTLAKVDELKTRLKMYIKNERS